MRQYLFAVLAVFVLLGSSSAQPPTATSENSYLDNKIRIIELQVFSPSTANIPSVHGYVEYRFQISNEDEDKAHRVDITIPNAKNSSSHDSELVAASSAIELAPKSSAVLTILQPPLPIPTLNRAQVTIDGRVQRNTLQFGPMYNHCRVSFMGHGGPRAAHFMFTNRIPADMRDFLEKGSTSGTTVPVPSSSGSQPVDPSMSFGMSGSYSGGPDTIVMWRSDVECNSWGTNWLAYTRFDGIAITDNEIMSLSNDIFAGIRRYVEAGGILVVVGKSWTPPKEWEDANEFNNSSRYRAMLGSAFVIPADTKSASDAIGAIRARVFDNGDRFQAAMSVQNQYNNYGMYGSGQNYNNNGILAGGGNLISDVPVVSAFEVPIKRIMVLILLFAVLIGPVNIYVLSILKKRIWLLWTVPLTSVVASMLVLGINFFQEGFVRHYSSASTTVLDQRRGEAVTFGYVGFYSTLTPSGGITFENTTEATHCFDRGDGNRRFEIVNVGGSQNFTRGWINARLPSYYAVRKVQPRLERLEFQWGNDPNVLNGIGVRIDKLLVCSPSGEYYELSGSLPAGEKGKLVKCSSQARTITPGKMTEELAQRDYNVVANWGKNMYSSSTELAPGSYRAIVAANTPNPFLEPGIENMKPFNNRATIYGFFQ